MSKIKYIIRLCLCVCIGIMAYGGVLAQGYEEVEYPDRVETWHYEDGWGWHHVSTDWGPDGAGVDPDGGIVDGDHDGDYDEDGDIDGDDGFWDEYWQDPWDGWDWYDDDTQAGGGTGPTTKPCPELSSRTFQAPNRERLTIGIGEEVEVRIKNRCGATVRWEIEGQGKKRGENNRTFTFQAGWTPGKIKVKATLYNLDGDCSSCNRNLVLEFEVVAPNGIYIERIPTPITGEEGIHEQYRVSCGYLANIYILPDNVNFYNVTFQEGTCMPSRVDGPYHAGRPLALHVPADPTEATKFVSPGKGTQLKNPDEIYFGFDCRARTNPSLEGVYNYEIDQFYLNKDITAFDDWKRFEILYQFSSNLGGENSIFGVSKKSATNPAHTSFKNYRVNDLTTSFQFEPLLNCD